MAKKTIKKETVLLFPRGVVFFEGTSEKIPKEGAEIKLSTYYLRLKLEGSLVEEASKNSQQEKDL